MNARKLRLLIAGGGTGGHVMPAVAVVEELRRRELDVELLWIGGHTGVEGSIAANRGIPFAAVQTGKIRRYVDIRTLVDLVRIPIGIGQAAIKVRRFRPDVIFSTGGNVSVPSVVGGRRVAPILTHEQTAQVGLANRTAARFATRFAVAYEETAVIARNMHQSVVVTGNPVRESLKGGDAERGRRAFGLSVALPVVYVTGGARGASPLNTRIEALVPELLEHCQIVHQAGPASANDDAARLAALRDRFPPALRERYVVREFITDEQADLFALADLVIGRAGAGTVAELAYLGLPSILIPLPGTWGDEQRKNARVLSNAGAAVLLEQDGATPETLRETILAIIGDAERQRAMREAARALAKPNAASDLVDELLALVR